MRVDPQNRVSMASEAAAGQPPMSTMRPSYAGEPFFVTECPPGFGRCLKVMAVRTGNSVPSSPPGAGVRNERTVAAAARKSTR